MKITMIMMTIMSSSSENLIISIYNENYNDEWDSDENYNDDDDGDNQVRISSSAYMTMMEIKMILMIMMTIMSFSSENLIIIVNHDDDENYDDDGESVISNAVSCLKWFDEKQCSQ